MVAEDLAFRILSGFSNQSMIGRGDVRNTVPIIANGIETAFLEMSSEEARQFIARPTMDEVWMQTAVMLSKRSTCERLQVGCLITDMDKRTVLGNGYNGGAKGQTNACQPSDPCGHLHAEVNALIACGSGDRLKVMYVTTLPCEQCAKAIVNSGFIGVYYLNDHEKKGSMAILKAANITLTKI